MEWIKCSERIPEVVIDGEEIDEDILCLVYSPASGIECVSILDYFSDVINGRGSNGSYIRAKGYIEDGITHWMPSPLPPTE